MADREKIKQFMEAEFLPEDELDAQDRIANALEYIAYHMGQINKKLDGIDKALTKIAQRS